MLRIRPKEPIEQEKPEETRPVGRPSLYKKEYARMAAAYCKLGATDADLATLFDVDTSTIWLWSVKHPEFSSAVRGEKQEFDASVRRSLAQRALGYTVDVEEVKITKDGDEVRYNVRKHYPPDVTACIFWLKNRQPKQWRDVQEHVVKDAETVTAEELRKQILAEAIELGIMPEQVLTKGVAPQGNGQTKH